MIGIFTFSLLYRITEYISVAKLCCTFNRTDTIYENGERSASNSIGVLNTLQNNNWIPINQMLKSHSSSAINLETNINNQKKPNYSLRTTYMLIILSKWFIILHVPYVICWLMLHIDELNSDYKNSTTTDYSFSLYALDVEHHLKIETRRCIMRALNNLAEVIFITNYAINFLLYTINGKFFRKRCKETFIKLIYRY